MHELKDWLDSLGLAQHLQLLVQHDIDMAVLRLLNERDLQELGLSLGHRKRLMKGVADLLQADAAAAQAAAQARPPTTPQLAPADPMLAGERRQLTVLFCDMVGFTELAGRLDPEVLQGVVKRYEAECTQAIRRYEGHVFQLLGDGVVAFFGYPQAHEDEAERAIRAGLDIIEAFSQLELPAAGRLQVRLGIATGLVVVLPDNGGAVGDTMNLAARLQAMAQPGSIVTSEHVHRLATATVQFESLGEQAIKGIGRPMKVWRVLGLRQVDSRFQARRLATMLPLVGRQAEYLQMSERWRLASGGQGQVLVVAGEAGIGKSRLARAAIDAQRDAPGVWVAELQCSPFHTHSPLFPVAEHLRQRVFADGAAAPAAADNAARWAAIEAFVATTQLPPAETTPLVAQLLGVAPPEAQPPSTLSPERARLLMRQTLLALVLDRARSGPGIYLVEDLHWADPSTLDLLSFLVEQIGQAPVLMVLTHRSEFEHPLARAPRAPHVLPLPLGRLSPEHSAELVRLSCRDAGLPAELLRRVVEKTDGVPLYIEEFSQAVVESRHAAMAAAVADVVIPDSLRDSLFARLDLLGSAKGVAQLAAMLGREFQGDVLAVVWPADPASLAHGLARLVEAGFIQRVGPAVRQRFAFKHALVQDAAYESMLKGDRIAHHRRIALAMEARFTDLLAEQPELVAHHCAAGQFWDKATALWLAAGALALRRNAHVEAVAHLRSALAALAELPDSPARALQELDIQLTLGTALVAAKGYASPDLQATFGRAHQLCDAVGQVPQRIPALFGLWMFNTVGAHHPQAHALAGEIVQLSEALGSDDLMIEAHLGQGISNFFQGRFAAALANFHRVGQLYVLERHGGHCFQFGQDPLVIALIYQGWIHWLQGDFARALDMGDRGLDCAKALQHPFTLSFALSFAAWQRLYGRQVDEADALVTPLLALCTEEDIPVFLAHGLVMQAWVMAERGQPEAPARMQAALDAFRATGSRCFLPHWVSFQADHLASRGDTTQARQLMDQALATIPASQEHWAEPEVLRLDALLQQRLGAPADAVEAGLRQALKVAEGLGARAWALRCSLTLARHLVPDVNAHTDGTAARRTEAAALLHQALAALPPDTGPMPSRDLAEARHWLASLGP